MFRQTDKENNGIFNYIPIDVKLETELKEKEIKRMKKKREKKERIKKRYEARIEELKLKKNDLDDQIASYNRSISYYKKRQRKRQINIVIKNMETKYTKLYYKKVQLERSIDYYMELLEDTMLF